MQTSTVDFGADLLSDLDRDLDFLEFIRIFYVLNSIFCRSERELHLLATSVSKSLLLN